MTDIMKVIAEQFGLVPLYALIMASAGFTASSFKHLIFVLGILSGIYVTMFKAFNLKAQFGPVDITQYVPVTEDVGNMIVAVGFVYIIGFAAYSAKRMFVPQNA
jgi:hypothetical protein